MNLRCCGKQQGYDLYVLYIEQLTQADRFYSINNLIFFLQFRSLQSGQWTECKTRKSDSIYVGLVSQQSFNVQNGSMSQTDFLNSYHLMQNDVLYFLCKVQNTKSYAQSSEYRHLMSAQLSLLIRKHSDHLVNATRVCKHFSNVWQ